MTQPNFLFFYAYENLQNLNIHLQVQDLYLINEFISLIGWVLVNCIKPEFFPNM